MPHNPNNPNNSINSMNSINSINSTNSNLSSEKYSVQDPLIGYVSEPTAEYTTPSGERIFLKLGWQRVSQDEALRLRDGERGIVFKEVFNSQLHKLNPHFMTDEIAEGIIKQIERIPPTIEGNFTAWEYLKGLRSVFVPNEKRQRNVRFIDAEDIENNIFQVTDEFSFTNGNKTIRQDVVFLINGIPLIFVETKSASKIEGMSEALEQIRRYHRDCPEILSIEQVYAITHIIKYFYSATWNLSPKNLLNWKEEAQADFETLVKRFFDRKRIVEILTNFILFTRQDDELKKVILRPHQMRAVDKLIERAKDREKNHGLIWHTQGSGKTYTMIVTAKRLIENPIFENPTVIMLVDRNELESQLFGNISAVGLENVEVAKSREDLRRLLKSGRRGLIVSMIHKFEGMPENINTRENIFVLIDEAHRTTTGKLGNYLMGALPNATYFGFTGTPIDKTAYGKGTFKTFGIDDPPYGYLDRYNIRESIEDGTTVSLHYTLAPNELRVDRDTLEREFLSLAETEGLSDVEELNKVLEKAVTLKNMLKNKERVDKIAKYVADHFIEYVEPMGYKAFLVAVDREACALYKERLDKYLPYEYSRVVFSPYYNDPPELSMFHLTEEEEKRVRRDFKDADKLPKILIVTEKLLTGFDAPILYCMYLDKPMRDHVLLQAIARVNRPYEDKDGRKKPSGFVLDFVGIFENLEKALAFDSRDIEGVVKDIDVLKERFSELIKEAEEGYLKIIEGKTRDKAVEAVLENFHDEGKRHGFYQFFREISGIYDVLSPDPFLRPYLEKMETLAEFYRILREAYEPGISIDRDFSRKVSSLVQKHTKSGSIGLALDIYEIDENTLKRIEESTVSDTEKVFNILRSIKGLVNKEASNSPYLISIGERAELLAQLFKERQKTTHEILESLKKLIEEINEAKRQQVETGMPSDVFTVYWLLKKEGIDNPDVANKMGEILMKYPHWRESERHERNLKTELIGIFIGYDMSLEKPGEIVKKILEILKGAKQ